MAGRNTIAQVPADITNPIALRGFLLKIVEQLDFVLSNRALTTSIGVVQTDLTTASTATNSAVGSALESDQVGLLSRIETLETQFASLDARVTALE
jgi:hypothetical protein